MAFLITTDYDIVIKTIDLPLLVDGSTTIQASAEADAQSYITARCQKRYDMAAMFAAQGNAREGSLIRLMIYLAIYYMHGPCDPKFIPEIVRNNYADARSDLKDIQMGMLDMPWPTNKDDQGAIESGRRFGNGDGKERPFRTSW